MTYEYDELEISWKFYQHQANTIPSKIVEMDFWWTLEIFKMQPFTETTRKQQTANTSYENWDYARVKRDRRIELNSLLCLFF